MKINLCFLPGLLFFAAVSHGNPAHDLLEESGVNGGFAVCMECEPSGLPAALIEGGPFLVNCLYSDPEKVKEAGKFVESKKLWNEICVNRWTGEKLPYAGDMVNLLVLGKAGLVPEKEIRRVTAPRGVVVARKEEKWTTKQEPWPEGMDRWTHYLYDASGNAVSKDEGIVPPLNHLRWRCGPRWCRSHETDMSLSVLVSGGGRVFYILDEGPAGIYDTRGSGAYRFSSKWFLVARDGFNGVLLWKRPMEDWGSGAWDKDRWRFDKYNQLWSSPLTLQRRLVASEDRLYVTLEYNGPVSEIDAVTGKKLRELKGTRHTAEMVLHRGVLVFRLKEVKPESGRGEEVVAIDTASGRRLWNKECNAVAALTLAASGNLVCYQDAGSLLGLSLRTGKELWRTSVRKRNAASLLIHKDVVLLAGKGKAGAFSARNGKRLWQRRVRSSFRGLPDIMVAAGKVWLDNQFEGFDISTGKVAKKINPGHLFTRGHHFRCYRCKATEDYLLFSKRGVEFLDLHSDRHTRHDWVRGTCRYGFMPANGLLYAPPDPCFCYPGVKLDGFNALAGGGKIKSGLNGNGRRDRLEKGPAFLASPTAEMKEQELAWPTYRHDPARSGSTWNAVPLKLKKSWQADLGVELTPPVAAAGRLLVAGPGSRRVYCLDASNGALIWSFAAGGPVDSPPTIFSAGSGNKRRLFAVFGCCDGSVVCLRLSDGKLAWRFTAAPCEKRIVSFGRLESSWPVHGSVLMKNGVVYFAAGRSSFLDSGIYLYGVNALTGKVCYKARLAGPKPDLDKPNHRPHEMDGAKNDILVSQGKYIFLTQNVFDMQLKRIEAPKIAKHGARKAPLHLLATGGFLDDTWFDRTYWLYARRWPGQYVAVNASKAGQILVFDSTTTYGLHVFTGKFSRSPRFSPGSGYELFADSNQNEPYLSQKQAARERGVMSRSKPPKWTKRIPVRARGMVLAGDRLFLAGPPDVVEENDPFAGFEGRSGAELWVVSSADGGKLAEYQLDCPPVFDGLIAADGKLYLCLVNGSVLCMDKR